MIAVDEDFEAAAEKRLIARELNFALARVKRGEAAALLFLGDSAGHVFRGGVGARRIRERKNAVVLRGVEEREGFGEIGIGFAREADDDIRGDADGATRSANPGDFFEI